MGGVDPYGVDKAEQYAVRRCFSYVLGFGTEMGEALLNRLLRGFAIIAVASATITALHVSLPRFLLF